MNATPDHVDMWGYPSPAWLQAVESAAVDDGRVVDELGGGVDDGRAWFSVTVDGRRLMLEWRMDQVPPPEGMGTSGVEYDPIAPDARSLTVTRWFDYDGVYMEGSEGRYANDRVVPDPQDMSDLVDQVVADARENIL